MPNLNLLDVVRLNAGDATVGLIEESLAAHPELNLGSARTISGIGFDSLVRTSLPGVGFRLINEGVATSKSTYVTRRSETSLVDASSEMDKAIGQTLEDGIEGALALEMQGKIEAAMRSMASQFYYGTASTVGVSSTALQAAKGFPGLVDMHDTSMVVDAAGVSGATTSVWLVKFGAMAVQWIVGRDGEFAEGELQDPVRLTDGSGNPYDGVRKALTFWMGVHCANPLNSIARVKNIDTAATLTDDMIDEAVSLFPAGTGPDVVLMTRRSLLQLKNSRTATTTTGASAAWPTEIVGITGNIPIAVTDAISEAETA